MTKGSTSARALLLFAGLAACGSDREASGFFDIGRQAVGVFRADGVGTGVLGAQNVQASDAQLRAFGRPLLKITRATQGLSAAVILQDNKGSAVTWRSLDGKAITLFNGLLISTKGFGNDLSSAKVPSIVAGQSDVLREHYYLGGDEVIRRSAYFCDFTDGGAQTISLVGISVATTVVTEQCVGEQDSFENRYWFNAAGGIVKSAQWVSPETETLIIEFVPQTGPASPTPVTTTTGGATVISGSL